MNPLAINNRQADALAALEALAARLGWNGEAVSVEGALVYQTPLPTDPNVSGAFFVVDPGDANIRLYLTLPFKAPPERSAEASEFVIRAGNSRRFGALEFDPDEGTLRIRMDIDVADAALGDSIARLLDRAMALARAVSPGWRALAGRDSRIPRPARRPS